MPIKFIDLDGLEPAEPGTYKGKGAIAPQIDECGDACAGTNNYRWTWGNDQWNKVDFNVTITELKSIFKKGKSDALQQIEMQVNLEGANYGITSKKSLAHFLSQAGHEVGGFSKGLNRIESLNYSINGLTDTFDKYFYSGTAVEGKYNADSYGRKKGRKANQEGIANIVYSNRMGNGDSESGDGFKYRGRGIFQLTGKSNYSAFNTFANICDMDFVNKPSLVLETEYSIMSAMWFYKVNVVDKIDVESASVKLVTRKVNGGSNGLSDRIKIYKKALKALN